MTRLATDTRAVQSAYYDTQYADDFEIERPHGTPDFYEYLMRFKFGRGLEQLGESIAGRSVLCICAGAGMDVEFLAESGARVTALDISVGAMVATRERGRRHGFNANLVAADGERLPFADASFDFCYVHDGLHHLDNPTAAIAELARVARYGVVITEPADAALTSLAIRLGLIPAFEEAGNFVRRFSPAELSAFFRSAGFSGGRATRYLMKYPHVPNALFHLLSRPAVYPLTRLAFRLLGAGLLAPIGNKITFAATR